MSYQTKKRTVTKSRVTFEQVYKVKEINGEFFQDRPRAGLKPIYIWRQAKNHKYGKTVVYDYVLLYNYETHKQAIMSYHSFVYAWYKGEVPAGYDVDHIDGDTLNNDIDNLQLLTHDENIKKRGKGQNQYTAKKLQRDIQALEQFKTDENKHIIESAQANWQYYSEDVRNSIWETLLA